MIWKLMGVFILLALSITPSFMQQAAIPLSSSDVVVYNRETWTLYKLSDAGLEILSTFPEMEAFGAQYPSDYYQTGFYLTPDFSRLIIRVDEYPVTRVHTDGFYSLNITTGACCESLNPQDPQRQSKGGEPLFSPDGLQVAILYVPTPEAQPEGITSQMIVFDLQTRNVVTRFEMSRLGGYDNRGKTYWTEEGISFYIERCCAADDRIEGVTLRWNPETDSLSDPREEDGSRNWFNTLRLSTGEAINIGYETTLPRPSATYPSNAVFYTTVDHPDEGQIIYFNPDHLQIISAQWIADGQAILVTHDDGVGTVLFRDGTQITLSFLQEEQFSAGTPDGWIMRNTDTKTYIYFRLNNQSIESFIVGEYTNQMALVALPRLGTSQLESTLFPAIAHP